MKNSLRLIMLAIMSLVVLNVSATERLTAVLQHNGTPRAFYGENALVEAVEAAEPGDLISLSRGTFLINDKYNITKALKIQGYGDFTTIKIKNSSRGYLYLNIPAEQSGLHLEGLNFGNCTVTNSGTFLNTTIKNCKFPYSLNPLNSSNHTLDNCEISQCHISSLHTNAMTVASNLYIHNCIIGNNDLKIEAVIDRCVITSTPYSASNHSIKNSIINGNLSSSSSFSSTMRYTNVIYDSSSSIAEPLYSENMIGLSRDEIKALFKSTATYELTDEAAARYEFNGSQIGAYGGSTPYTLIPAIPQITSAAVPSTVSADGQLQISFTVEAHD